MLINLEDIKIKSGYTTTIIGERQIGLTEYLIKLANELAGIDYDYKILFVSHSYDCARETYKRFLNEYKYSENIDYCGINGFLNKCIGKKYDLIIYDCPNVLEDIYYMNTDIFKNELTKNAKVIIGITWENIAFDKNVNKAIRKRFIEKSRYAYYITLDYRGKKMIYDVRDGRK